MLRKLKQALSQRQKSHIVDPDRTASAVLVPVYYKQDGYYLLFTKRTDTVMTHKGQISFPGGTYEEEDGTLLDTALRESAEEIGLAAEAVEPLGELDDTVTTTSSYVISPFVAAIPWPYSFKTDPGEVEEIIEVPISALLSNGHQPRKTKNPEDPSLTTDSYDYKGQIIWGATARILKQFLGIWVQATGE